MVLRPLSVLLLLLALAAVASKPVEFIVNVAVRPEWAHGPASLPLRLECRIDSEAPTSLELADPSAAGITIEAIGQSKCRDSGNRELDRQTYRLTVNAPATQPFGREIPMVVRDAAGNPRARFALSVLRERDLVYASSADLESLRREARARAAQRPESFQHENDPQNHPGGPRERR